MVKIKPRVTVEEKNEIKSNLYTVFWSFLWTLLAFWWTTFINELLDLISVKYELPELALVTSLVYAIIITIFALTLMISIKRFLNFLVDMVVVEVDNLWNDIWKKKKEIDLDFE